MLKQYRSYLKGFYFHSTTNFSEALKWYTHSLEVTERHSINFLRLQALENIEQIIAEKKSEEANRQYLKKLSSSDVKLSQSSHWNKKTAIYDMLSHHYILRKSVVFIVDTEFSSVVYMERANRYVKEFFNGLNGKDHFGYISLGKDAQLEQFPLEQKEKNTHLKEMFMKKMGEKEPELIFTTFEQVSGGTK